MPLVISLIKTYSLSFSGGLHGLGFAVVHESGESIGDFSLAIQDTVDRVFAGDILNLASTQFIGLCQDIGILIATTNLATNLDSAFERRFLYKIEF